MGSRLSQTFEDVMLSTIKFYLIIFVIASIFLFVVRILLRNYWIKIYKSIVGKKEGNQIRPLDPNQQLN